MDILRTHETATRRQLLAALALLLSAPLALGQQSAATVKTIGVLSPFSAPTAQQIATGANTARLRELGWIEGQNLRMERMFGAGEARLPELAAELVRKGVDVIYAAGPEAALAAARATTSIPIVFWGVGTPVQMGLVESFDRPGRNATGVVYADADPQGLSAKRYDLLKEVLPGARRVAWLAVAIQDSATRLQSNVAMAKDRGIDLETYAVKGAGDFDAALRGIAAAGPQALLVDPHFVTGREAGRILDFGRQHRIPVLSGDRLWVERGALASYGPVSQQIGLQALDLVDKVLRGANPAALPVEYPKYFEVSVNVKTAGALGVTVPQSVLARAGYLVK